jgi:hypothetical protein
MKHEIKNKILHSVRTPLFKSKVFKDKKKESKKNGNDKGYDYNPHP